jgi:hypothetical protein
MHKYIHTYTYLLTHAYVQEKREAQATEIYNTLKNLYGRDEPTLVARIHR